MKKWYNTQQFGLEIAEIDRLTKNEKDNLNLKEMGISQAAHVAKVICKLYKKGGVDYVLGNLYKSLATKESFTENGKLRFTFGLTNHQKNRAVDITRELFKHHWFPFSRIRRNMKRLTK